MPNGTSTVSPGPGDGRSETDATIAPTELKGTLFWPTPSCGVVLFAHGRGSGRLSPRSRFVASRLQEAGQGTLIFDLLLDKKAADRRDFFDIPLLARWSALASD